MKRLRFTFYIPGMEFDGETIQKGKSLGGSESSGYYLAKEVAKNGHDVFVFCNTPEQKYSKKENVFYLPIGNRTENNPLGENFLNYATHVPQDVLIAQRLPFCFSKKFNTKINLWWTHDLGFKRTSGYVNNQLWNIDRVLSVSRFHKKQISEVYGITEDFIDVLPNGIDLDLFSKVDVNKKIESKTMVYSSRPERGLDKLVGPGGIMEQLYEKNKEIKLIVCNYEHVSQEMENMYNQLYSRCEQLPNVEMIGHLSKKNLANLMCNSWLHIYPSNDFEETSCITVMEAQASGNPVICSDTGALSETLNAGGYRLLKKDSKASDYVDAILNFYGNKKLYKELNEKALKKAKTYTYSRSYRCLIKTIKNIFGQSSENTKHINFLKNSDIHFLRSLKTDNKIAEFIEQNIKELSTQEEKKDFYDEVAQYNFDIKNTHRLGNYVHHLNMERIKPILKTLNDLPKDSVVLDFGCCVGQVTTSYAKAFPHLKFVGTDIAKEQIKVGQNFIEKEKIENVSLISLEELDKKDFDALVCSEVLEHVENYQDFLENLLDKVKEGGKIILTTPVGPYEQIRWNTQTKREHVHHFEYQDIIDIFGQQENFDLNYVFGEFDKFHNACGNWTTHFTKSSKKLGIIDYNRKNQIQNPNQTLSACIIAKAEMGSLQKTLDSIQDICDEIIIGLDGNENETLNQFLNSYNVNYFYFDKSVLELGFDEARNRTVEKANMDWILWIDSDETLIHGERLVKYLRNNQFLSYAIAQLHVSVEPAGIIKTDYPCRVFRNKKGIKFHGVVHEHPEIEINKSCPPTYLINPKDLSIMHNGYDTEDTRRNRFKRNFPLMVRDREKNPERKLGIMLWIRDLCHLNRYEYENTGKLSQEGYNRCLEAISFWRKLLNKENLKMAKETLSYYSECAAYIAGNACLKADFHFEAYSDILDGDSERTPENVKAKFLNREDLEKFNELILQDKLDRLEGKYI